jgi:hypothetical protein
LGRLRGRPGRLLGLLVEVVSEFAHGICRGAQGGDRLRADLGDDVVIDVSGGVAQLHFNEFDGFFNATAYAALSWWWGWISTHE